jgi:hypothetical protein
VEDEREESKMKSEKEGEGERQGKLCKEKGSRGHLEERECG